MQDNKREHPSRSCAIFLMVRISEVPLFLIVFDLLFRMQAKSEKVKYYQKQWYLDFKSSHKNFCTAARGVFPFWSNRFSMRPTKNASFQNFKNR